MEKKYGRYAIVDNTVKDISYMLPFLNRGVSFDFTKKITFSSDDINEVIKRLLQNKTNEFKIKLDLLINELNSELMSADCPISEARAYGRLDQAKQIREMYEEIWEEKK
jgi:hypothetical protein